MKIDSRKSAATAPEGAYRRFFIVASLIVGALVLVGILPTRQLVGDEALPAMLAAILVAFAASAAGTLPIYMVRNKPPVDVMPAQLGAMALRLAVTLLLGVSLVFSGLVMVTPFLLWLVLAHSGLLVADTIFARAVVAASAQQHVLPQQ